MKSLITSLTIFFVMIVGIFFSINYLNKICAKLEVSMVQIEKDINDHLWDKAYDDSLNFLEEWKKKFSQNYLFCRSMEIEKLIMNI
jgi:hypothetical protein